MRGEQLPAARPLRAATYVESKHPRHPKGSEKGGEFAAKLEARDRAAAAYVSPPEQARAQADDDAFVARGKLGSAADAFYAGTGSLGELQDAYEKFIKCMLIRAEAG